MNHHDYLLVLALYIIIILINIRDTRRQPLSLCCENCN